MGLLAPTRGPEQFASPPTSKAATCESAISSRGERPGLRRRLLAVSVLLHSLFARLVGFVGVLAAVCTALLVAGASPAAASEASSNLSAINSARAQHGLKPLSMSSNLVSVASRWSQHMASGGCSGSASICHNPNLTSQVSGWQKIGENVGVGGSGSAIQSAFMNSSHHRANILDPAYTRVGIGTVKGADGRLYMTQDFMKPMGGTSVSPKRTTSAPQATARRTASTAPTARSTRPAPVIKAAAPRAVVNPMTARLRILTARAAGAKDPVSQAFAFHSAMGSLTAS